MKVGDLVSTRSKNFIGVIIETREMSATRRSDRGNNTFCHHIYWGDPKVEKNPVWVMEKDLVKAV